MDTHNLKITRPCPIDLDVDHSQRQFFCGHCQKDVHVLANWTRAEAEAFLAANRGKSVCVSLRRNSQGELVYADAPRPGEIVPISRLRRRWPLEAAAAAGVAAALSACTPHELPGHDTRHPSLEDEVVLQIQPGGVQVPYQAPPPQPMMDGEIAIPESEPKPKPKRGEKPADPMLGIVRGGLERDESPPSSPAPKESKTPEPVESEPCDSEPFLGGIEM